MMGGGIRFGFYDIFKKIIHKGLGDKYYEKFRWIIYGASAAVS